MTSNEQLSSREIDGLRRRLDEAEIRSVLENYAYAVDRRDLSVLGACFAEDAEWDANGVVRLGRDEIVANRALDKFASTNHIQSNTYIALDGDRAEARIGAVAILVEGGDRTDKPHALYRGIRYNNVLVRTNVGWRISRMEIRALWETRIPVSPVTNVVGPPTSAGKERS